MRIIRLIPAVVLLLTGCFEGQKANPIARAGKVSVPEVEKIVPPPVIEKPPVEKPPVEKPPVEKPVEPAAKPSIYDRLGKEAGVSQIVDDFVANVVADPDIKERYKKHFMEGDVPGLKKKLLEQIGEATGGPQKYTGKNMKDAHKGMEITNKDFDALAGDLAKSFDKNKVSKDDKDAILKVLEGMRKDVVEKED
jgi:hemoglobin